MSMRVFHTVVVGAGPGGLMAAYRSDVPAPGLLLLDGGDDVEDRVSALGFDSRGDVVTRGFGGAGLFSDGKLCLSPRIGSTVSHRFPPSHVSARQHAIDEVLRSGERAGLHGGDAEAAADFEKRAKAAGLEYVHYPVRHVGTDQLPRMLGRLRTRLAARATIVCRTRCIGIRPSGRSDFRWELELDGPGVRRVQAVNVVLAPGKVGASWLGDVGRELGLGRDEAQPKIGFRLEGAKEFLGPLLEIATDPKVIWSGPEGVEVRTHCVCYGGDVVAADYHGLTLVGGHATSAHAENRSNSAIIATAGRRLPLTADDARGLVAAINRRHGGLVGQRLGAFLPNTSLPSGQAIYEFVPSLPDVAPGDFTAEFPPAIVSALRTFLFRLSALCPGVLHPDNFLYGPAVERWASRFTVTDEMEAPGQPGLYLVGDGPGLTGGIIGAAETGWLAGDAITAQTRR
ncbi:dehydrogenase [Protofrankia symbiont of Coriaria ruscifolia]|uniref:dehydrogenase n=1 Tax=Protofrankia symbiont of Coriaria ruscifolia TaxID=1306542 RepID=UPI0010413CDE|nr:dehydrogenase [Protofrankia symbiont of Coriaria ruscifolia]